VFVVAMNLLFLHSSTKTYSRVIKIAKQHEASNLFIRDVVNHVHTNGNFETFRTSKGMPWFSNLLAYPKEDFLERINEYRQLVECVLDKIGIFRDHIETILYMISAAVCEETLTQLLDGKMGFYYISLEKEFSFKYQYWELREGIKSTCNESQIKRVINMLFARGMVNTSNVIKKYVSTIDW
jgi:hypothetical protein